MELRSGACGLDGYESVVDENCAWTGGQVPVVWSGWGRDGYGGTADEKT